MILLVIQRYFVLAVCLFCTQVQAQQQTFAGTYMNVNSTMALRLKPVGEQFHGLLQASTGNYAIKANPEGNTLSGIIYYTDGPVDFSAVREGNVLDIAAFGITDRFIFVKESHKLENIDLTFFMVPDVDLQLNHRDTDSTAAISTSAYYIKGQSSEVDKYPFYTGRPLYELTANSQLAVDADGKTVYFNLCKNGFFYVNNNAETGKPKEPAEDASGSWYLILYQDSTPAIFLTFNNGQTTIIPVDMARMLKGSWQGEHESFSLKRDVVNCY